MTLLIKDVKYSNTLLFLQIFNAMIRYLLIFLLSFLFEKASYSQAKYDGYIILLSGDTVNGSIVIPINKGALDFISVSEKVKFIDSAEKVKTYKPDALKGFGINADELSSHYISLVIKKDRLFLKRIVHGDWQMYEDVVSLYKSFSYPGVNGSSQSVSRKWGDGKDYYIIFNNEPVKLERKPASGFLNIKQLRKIFHEHPDILSKLTDELQWFQLREIVEEFSKSSAL